MENIQAIDVPIQLSADNGATWKPLVCITDYDVPLETDNNVTNTFCGPATGLGPVKFTPKGTAVADISNNGMWNYRDLLNFQVGRELIKFKVEFPGSGGSAGIDFFLSGDCYVTSTDMKASVGNVITFDFTLSGVGDIDINA